MCTVNKHFIACMAAGLWAAGSTWAQLPVGSCCRLAHTELSSLQRQTTKCTGLELPEIATGCGSIASLLVSLVHGLTQLMA